MIGEQQVLTHALVLKRLANGGHNESVVHHVTDANGEEFDWEEEVTITHYAEPGEVIDVSAWADIQAHVNMGWIQLLTAEQVQSYEAKQQQQRRGARNERTSP